MKKHWKHSGSNTKYDTYEEAEVAAKKYMASDRYSKNHALLTLGYGGCGSWTETSSGDDVYIYEASACVKFPIPVYEVEKLS